MKEAVTNSRIKSLDGLRAFAALGVLWIHTWSVHGQPGLRVGPVDLIKPISLVGNGVDLFFVISGFCMYYFYAGNNNFEYRDFLAFLKKRWLRLSPAFYFATIVYAVYRWSTWKVFILKFLTSVFYLNSISSYSAEGFLWSLGPEWQFYIVVPFILIYQHKFGFTKTLTGITLFFLISCIAGILLLKRDSEVLSNQLFFRYFEFLWGIVIGRLFFINKKITSKHYFWFIFFVLVTYAGRTFLSKQVLSLSDNYFNFFKIIGFNIMGLGFAGIIYVSLCSDNLINIFLESRFMAFVGKISFSFYLWHGLIHMLVAHWVMQLFPQWINVGAPLLSFTLSTLILMPLSYLSYRYLEVPFFIKKRKF